jgi:hypothetical protein
MEIKETELRREYEQTFHIPYYINGMKYMFWRRAKIKEYKTKHSCITIYRNDPEAMYGQIHNVNTLMSLLTVNNKTK